MPMANTTADRRRAHGIPENVASDFGRRVRQVRETLGSGGTQENVAGRMRELGHNWQQTTLSKVEKGQRPVSLDEAFCLAIVLGQHLRDFIGEGPGELQRAMDRASARFFEADQAWNLLGARVQEAEHEMDKAWKAIAQAASPKKSRKTSPKKSRQTRKEA